MFIYIISYSFKFSTFYSITLICFQNELARETLYYDTIADWSIQYLKSQCVSKLLICFLREAIDGCHTVRHPDSLLYAVVPLIPFFRSCCFCSKQFSATIDLGPQQMDFGLVTVSFEVCIKRYFISAKRCKMNAFSFFISAYFIVQYITNFQNISILFSKSK